MKIVTFEGGFDNNFSYLICNKENEAIIIDPIKSNEFIRFISSNNLNLKYIINTHSDFDHVQGNPLLIKNTKAKLISLNKNTPLALNEINLKFIKTPGHTQDSRCILLNNKYLFTGDTLFVNSIGRTNSKEEFKTLQSSLKTLSLLPIKTVVYPGHNYGPTPTSTIKTQKNLNPYFQSFT